MNVADRARGKCIGDLPALAAVGRGIDMNLGAFAIVEIFSPVNSSAGSGGDMQRARAAADFVSHPEFIAFRSPRDDRAGNGGDQGALGLVIATLHSLIICWLISCWLIFRPLVFRPRLTWIGKNCQSVKAVAHKSRTESRSRGEISPPAG